MRFRAAVMAVVRGLLLGACTSGTDVPGDPLSVRETSVEPVPASPEVPSPAPSGPESAVAAEKRLHRSGARADKKQLHVGAGLFIQAGIVAEPENREGSSESRVRDAEFLPVKESGVDDDAG